VFLTEARVVADGISVSIEVSIYTLYGRTGSGQCYRALRGELDNDDQVNPAIYWRLWRSAIENTIRGHGHAKSEMHLEATIKWVGGMHLDAKIEWTQRCTAGHDPICLQIHLEAMMMWSWPCTRRLRWIQLGDSLGGCDRVDSEMHSCALIEWIWIFAWRRSSLEVVNWKNAWCWDSIHRLVNSQWWKSNDVILSLIAYGELDGGGQYQWRYTGCRSYIQYSTWSCENEGKTDNYEWMLCLVLTHEHGMERKTGMT